MITCVTLATLLLPPSVVLGALTVPIILATLALLLFVYGVYHFCAKVLTETKLDKINTLEVELSLPPVNTKNSENHKSADDDNVIKQNTNNSEKVGTKMNFVAGISNSGGIFFTLANSDSNSNEIPSLAFIK